MNTTLDRLTTAIADALRAAEMEKASFGFPDDRIEVKIIHARPSGDVLHPTDYVKDITALYRKTWIIGPLKQALQLAEENRELLRQCDALREAMRTSGIPALIELARAGMKED